MTTSGFLSEIIRPKNQHMCHGLNSHCFHIIGDKVINPIVGVYIPIIRIPIKGGMTIPNIATFDHGTYMTWDTPPPSSSGKCKVSLGSRT